MPVNDRDNQTDRTHTLENTACRNPEALAAYNFKSRIKTEALLKSQAVMNIIKVVISEKQCKIETLLLQQSKAMVKRQNKKYFKEL